MRNPHSEKTQSPIASPAASRNSRCEAKAVSDLYPTAVAASPGRVPAPNANMIPAPPSADPLSRAVNSAPYTIAHGIIPQASPTGQRRSIAVRPREVHAREHVGDGREQAVQH